MARLLCLDVSKGVDKKEAVRMVECSELEDYYKELNCGIFDITTRKIGGKWFDIFCDDNGLYAEDPIPSAMAISLNGKCEPRLVGNLIFANHDDEGNTTSLSEEDVEIIKSAMLGVSDTENGKSWMCVILDE